MALLIKQLIRAYGDYIVDKEDVRSKDWFLMSNPLPIICILTAYLLFVKDAGPKWMQDRAPYNLDKIMIWFNALQIILCGCVIIGYTPIILQTDIRCGNIIYTNEPPHLSSAKLGYLYFLIKILDLLDTVFFVLRKKSNQITFLHVYHHFGMVLLTWLGIKYWNGGHSIYLPYLNSMVHVVMYGYYLLAAYNESYKKNVWWKKYITQMQLIQFFLLFVIFQLPLYADNCQYPKVLVLLMVPQNLLMVVLFADFYYKAYIKKKPSENTQ